VPLASFRLFVDNAPVEQARMERFAEIRVDQAIGMAAEAELRMPVATSLEGAWDGLHEDFAQPFTRIRVEVKVGDGAFQALIDGPVVANRFELSAAPDESEMVLVVQDDSVLLDREEKVALFEDMAVHEIAESLIAEHGLSAEVDSTPDAGSALARAVVQRGTNMQLLRELARRHGMFVFVKPGSAPGASVGVFQRPRLAAGEAPELLLLGPERNVNRFSAEYDALRPAAVSAHSVRAVDKELLSSRTDAPSAAALGDVAAHQAATPTATLLLARMREEQDDLDAATAAAAELSSWAYSASAEVDADIYPGVLAPHQVVRVAGIGGFLSGAYLVSRVIHTLGDESYRQQVTLRRNARSAAAS
jgi:phage protein D